MKQENETFNCLKTTKAEGAEKALLKRAYVSPTTEFTRVLMEMDVLSASMVETRSRISAGFSDHAGDPFTNGDANDILIENSGW